MNWVGNLAPLVGGVLICAIAYVSVRRAHRKAAEAEREAAGAAE